MGLDVYVGSLTTYTLGHWQTIVQQVLGAEGLEVRVVRAEPEPADVVTDPAVVSEAVQAWQAGLLAQLGCSEGWREAAEMPYWTDKPDWDGYGGLVLLAAHDELAGRPGAARRGLFRRAAHSDTPRRWEESRAFQRASQEPERYPGLLLGVEWWLPIDGPVVFEAPTITGRQARMGCVDHLLAELGRLAGNLGLGLSELARIRHEGPPESDADVTTAGRFGLAVFHGLAAEAQRARLPLILDY